MMKRRNSSSPSVSSASTSSMNQCSANNNNNSIKRFASTPSPTDQQHQHQLCAPLSLACDGRSVGPTSQRTASCPPSPAQPASSTVTTAAMTSSEVSMARMTNSHAPQPQTAPLTSSSVPQHSSSCGSSVSKSLASQNMSLMSQHPQHHPHHHQQQHQNQQQQHHQHQLELHARSDISSCYQQPGSLHHPSSASSLSSSGGSLSSCGSSTSSPHATCYACNKVIYERFLLKAMDEYWHEDCLKCSCCGCRLGEVGSTLFTKANLILCKRDYLRLFGSTGTCLVCDGNIPAFELVMKVRGHNMHLECFKCQECNHRFCVGDKFYLYNNTKILCEYHYEERMVFANLPQNSLDQIKRSTHEFLETSGGSDGASSGYGSHSESPYTEHR